MNSWNGLFTSAAGKPRVLNVRLLRKHGRPLLLVPAESRKAERCLELYPAQSGKARMAKRLLQAFWKAGFFVKAEPAGLPFNPEDPFARYVSSLAGIPANEFQTIGILAGNPASGTQRFLILIFDSQSRPLFVVKAGLSENARTLVRAESEFLSTAPNTLIGLPRFISRFENPLLEAFATEYCPGNSPLQADDAQIMVMLSSWLNPADQRRLEHWPELVAAEKTLKSSTDSSIAASQVIRSCVQHGDFAPWNIKVSAQGSWTVLDWERGNLHGIPGWDWFHYLIQTGILVEKRGTQELIDRMKDMVASEQFKQYAQQAGIIGMERFLVGAYLLHLVEVIKPAEGLTENRALLEALRGHTF